MLLGPEVSAGWIDKASARVSARLAGAGFGGAMLAALAAQSVLAAGETPVSVLCRAASPALAAEGKEAAASASAYAYIRSS